VGSAAFDDGVYPLVNVYIANWKITMLSMGKSTISTGPFSIAMLVYQRVPSKWQFNNETDD